MNENKKSAIKQMVEQMKAELDGDLPREHRKAITPFYQVACRLLAEEQAQKPEAPAGMIGDTTPRKCSGCDLVKVYKGEFLCTRGYSVCPKDRPASKEATKCAWCGGSEREEIVDGKNALVCNECGRKVFAIKNPAPSSDEGSFKILEPNSVEQAIELYRNNPIFNRLVDLRVQEILSRHPAPKDRCAENLKKAIEIMNYARNHGGPVAYENGEDSVGYYVCCSNPSFKDHDEDCWYRQMCEFLDEFSKDADKGGK